MKHFDYQIILDSKKKNHKKASIAFYVSLAVYVLLFIGGIILSTYENKKVIMIIFSFLLSIVAVILIVLLVFGMIKNKKDSSIIIDILNSYLFDVEGKITSISQKTITIKNRKVNEITINDDNTKFVGYLDNEFNECPFVVGQQVKLRTASSFIVYYEAHDEETLK